MKLNNGHELKFQLQFINLEAQQDSDESEAESENLMEGEVGGEMRSPTSLQTQIFNRQNELEAMDPTAGVRNPFLMPTGSN